MIVLQTPWSTLRKVFLTDELVEFATNEFNHYPKTLAAMRARPFYIPAHLEWPPKWVNKTDRDGPMKLTPKQFLKYLGILYLLGAKCLQSCSLDDLFSRDPVMRE